MTKGVQGWEYPRLCDIAALNIRDASQHIPNSERVSFVPMAAVTAEFGGISVSDTRLHSEVRKGFTQFRAGDVLYAKITPCMENGKVAVVPPLNGDFGYGSTEFHIIRPTRVVEPKWLAHYLSMPRFRLEARKNMTGSAGQLRVPSKWLGEQRIPLPPLKEQRDIIARVEQLLGDLRVATVAVEDAKSNLARYRSSILKAAVEGRLTEQWRADNPDVEPAAVVASFRENQLSLEGEAKFTAWELPFTWRLASVSDIAANDEWAITDGPFGSNLKTSHYTLDGPRVIRLQNIDTMRFRDEKAHISPEHYAELRKHSVEPGDVVVAMLGENLPRACVTPDWLGHAITKADCVKISSNRALIDPTYLALALNAPTTRRLASSLISGVGRPRLNLAKLKSLPLPIPPLCEQVQIVNLVASGLSTVESLEAVLTQTQEQCNILRAAILREAFEGSLNG